MNKLPKDTKELYIEYYKALKLEKKGGLTKEDLLINPKRIVITVFRNLKTISECKFNDTLAQYYYLELANKYLEDKEEMIPKEV